MLCITCSRLDRGVTVKLHVLNSMFVSKELGWSFVRDANKEQNVLDEFIISIHTKSLLSFNKYFLKVRNELVSS